MTTYLISGKTFRTDEPGEMWESVDEHTTTDSIDEVVDQIAAELRGGDLGVDVFVDHGSHQLTVTSESGITFSKLDVTVKADEGVVES